MRLTWSFMFALLLIAPAHALTNSLAMTQLSHSVWRVKDGSFAGAPSSIAQTTDGYMWFGTQGGLYRFDGARLVPFAANASDEPLRDPSVHSLRGARDGSLWIGTDVDLERWKDGRLTHYPNTPSAVFGSVNQIVEARDGGIWVARSSIFDDKGAICEVDGHALKCHNQKSGMTLGFASGLMEDGDGRFLANSPDQLVRWNPRTAELSEIDMPIKGSTSGIQALAYDGEGALLVGTLASPKTAGLLRLNGGLLEPYPAEVFDSRAVSVSQVFVDSQKSLWIGTVNRGLYRIRGERIEHYGSLDGMSGDTVNQVYEDREGNIWVATTQGVDRFGDVKVASFSRSEGLSGELANAVAAARDGSIWVSNVQSIDILANGRVKSLKAEVDFPGAEVSALFEDRLRRMWVGTDRGLAVYEEGKFKLVSHRDGKPIGPVSVFSQDKQGDVWAIVFEAPAYVLLRIRDDRVVEKFPSARLSVEQWSAMTPDPMEGVWISIVGGDIVHVHNGQIKTFPLYRVPGKETITAMHVTPDGTIFVSSRLGFVGIRDGVTHALTTANGLPCNKIWAMLVDDQALWLYAECGLVSIKRSEFDSWWHDPQKKVHFDQIGSLDGVQPARSTWAPHSARSADGKLWFVNGTLLQMYDPNKPSINSAIAPVLIERLEADGTSYPPAANLRLPALTRNLEIDYTALSFVVPEKVQFRYMLEGFDTTWVEAARRRQAYYTNLKPGKYVFRVTASNNDGLWNPTGRVQAFEILPAFYQTTWFALMAGTTLLAAVWLLYLAKIRQVDENIRQRMDTQAKERERIARDLHDTLLQGMQGLIFTFHASAERLRSDEPERAMLETAVARADDVLQESREQVTGLRMSPVASGSLEERLRAAALDLVPGSAPHLAFARPLGEKTLRPLVCEELYRIGVEAIGNAVRHADAEEIEVVLVYGLTELVLSVRDDGRGFDAGADRSQAAPGHFGLVGMEERANRVGGVLHIASVLGQGSELTVRVPAAEAYEDAGSRRARWHLWFLSALRQHGGS